MEATVWTPLHLFETNLYNGPSLSHGVYICSSLLLMASWQVPHLSTGSRPDFNNDLGADSNNGPVLGPGVYLNLTQIMTPPWATPILCQMKYTSVQVSCLRCPGGCYIWPRAPMPDFNNGPGNDLNSTRILAPQCLFETDVNNDPPQANFPTLCQMENTSVQISYLWFSGGCLTPPQSRCSIFLQRT